MNPETRFNEQKLDAIEKLNELKRNALEQQLNVIKSEDDHNNKQILDHLNEKLHHPQNNNTHLKVNEIQFKSNEYGNILLNFLFPLDIQDHQSYFNSQLNQIKQDYIVKTKKRNI